MQLRFMAVDFGKRPLCWQGCTPTMPCSPQDEAVARQPLQLHHPQLPRSCLLPQPGPRACDRGRAAPGAAPAASQPFLAVQRSPFPSGWAAPPLGAHLSRQPPAGGSRAGGQGSHSCNVLGPLQRRRDWMLPAATQRSSLGRAFPSPLLSVWALNAWVRHLRVELQNEGAGREAGEIQRQ